MTSFATTSDIHDTPLSETAELLAQADSRSAQVSVTVFTDMAAAEPYWRLLESSGICSAYQHYDWLSAWQRNIGSRIKVEPRIAVVTDQGRPVMLLPFGLSCEGGLRVLRFLGGTHSNYNLGLFEHEFIAVQSPQSLRRILLDACMSTGRVDLVELRNQPETWLGQPNPLTALPHVPSANRAFSTTLSSDFDAFFRERRGSRGRKKLRWQERSLEKAGGYTFKRAENACEAHRVLAVFAEQKAARFNEQGIHNVFAEDGVMTFLHELVDTSFSSRSPAIELYYLSVDGKIRATFAGGVCGPRFSGFFNSISNDELTRTSPGELLLTRFLRSACERGLTEFDLGVGEARYKTAWCDHTDLLFDTLHGVTLRGKIAAAARRFKLSAKRRIKQDAALWALALRARKRLFGDKGCGCPSTTNSAEHPQ